MRLPTRTRSRPVRFFGLGGASVLGATVQMASAERALLDALGRPRYAGGLGEVSGMVQRLGYLADLNGVELPPRLRATLERLARFGGNVPLGPRRDGARVGCAARDRSVPQGGRGSGSDVYSVRRYTSCRPSSPCGSTRA
jgi:predicted transcriptional regulator of viral defense system